ncbi:MAG: hypothetical protein F6J93_16545 [Oscillatoria sp. SIO1A7]|nr:hypothetical protein [Oscillatoria sp. SIO1A7]
MSPSPPCPMPPCPIPDIRRSYKCFTTEAVLGLTYFYPAYLFKCICLPRCGQIGSLRLRKICPDRAQPNRAQPNRAQPNRP